MKLLRSRRAFLPVVFLAAIAASACDVIGPQDDLGGYYNYGGTVYNSPGHSVNGQLNISNSYGGSADVDVDWNFYEGSQRLVHVVTTRSVPTEVLSDGTMRFTVEGTLQMSDGTITGFTLTHEARRSGRNGLKGTWRLQTDLPSDDSGSFTATR